jgi:hypothetical protein
MKKSNLSLSSRGRFLKFKAKSQQISTKISFFGYKSKKSSPFFLAFLLSFLNFSNAANAGTGGSSEFQTMADTIQGYVTGTPALILLLCGLFYAIYLLATKHTVIPLGMVILAAIVASSGPAIITGLVSALI